MPTDKIEVTFKCEKCGATVIELPDNYTNESIAKCKSCGEKFGTWGAVKQKAVGVVRDKIQRDFRKAFSGSKVWKIK